jgi:hypothetical protein
VLQRAGIVGSICAADVLPAAAAEPSKQSEGRDKQLLHCDLLGFP